MEIKHLSTLYSLDKKNKVKEWSIKVVDKGDYSVIEWSYGYTGCKKNEYQLQLNSGKNLGRANQTGHFEQAVQEAESRWKKKRDLEGYSTDIPEPTATMQTATATVNGSMFPMLAQDYAKQAKKLKFPCYIQPKLDGYRMVYNTSTGTMTSRTGKPFTALRGTELEKELKLNFNNNIIIDGELYIHGQPFENLGVLRKTTGITDTDRKMLNNIEYHVYDIIDINQPFSERLKTLETLVQGYQAARVKLVNTVVCQTPEDVQKMHTYFTFDLGYEGTMLRNAGGLYKPKFRSMDLLKKKDFMDSEYIVTGFDFEMQSRSNSTKLVVWECDAGNGLRFSVRPQGTESEREFLYKNGMQFIGQKLWVKYFELTDKGVPRFPSTKTNTYKSYFRNNVE